jgi:L-lysine 2,3-aminomutase
LRENCYENLVLTEEKLEEIIENLCADEHYKVVSVGSVRTATEVLHICPHKITVKLNLWIMKKSEVL